MSRAEAKVVRGPRGPEARENAIKESRVQQTASKLALDHIQSLLATSTREDRVKTKGIEDQNRVTYQSRAGSYRLTLEAPADTFDPLTGKRTYHRGVTWRFNNGVFVSTDPREQEIAESRKSYKVDFWRASDAARADIKKAVAALVQTIKGAPEKIREEIMGELTAGAEGFSLPEVAPDPASEGSADGSATPGEEAE